MRDRVASPLGLSSLVPDHDAAAPGSERASFYQARRQGPSGVREEPRITHVATWRRVDLSQKLPGGGWTATPSDLARLGAAWLDDGYVSPDLREEFFTPVALLDGSANPQGYALGWRRSSWPIGSVGDVVHLNHGGVSKGSQAWLMVVPEYGVAVALAANVRTEDFFAFADVYVELLEAFLPRAVEVNAQGKAARDPS
jgi:CubicO group peptidase (beta-lactamase class C family)